MNMSRLFPALLVLIFACSFGVQGQLQMQNATSSIAYSTAPAPAPSVAQPTLSYYPSCYYNQLGQYVCNNIPYYNLGNYYPWTALLNQYSASNNLYWGGWGYYPGYGGYGYYPGYGGYGYYPGYGGYGYYPGYGGYGYYPGYL